MVHSSVETPYSWRQQCSSAPDICARAPGQQVMVRRAGCRTTPPYRRELVLRHNFLIFHAAVISLSAFNVCPPPGPAHTFVRGDSSKHQTATNRPTAFAFGHEIIIINFSDFKLHARLLGAWHHLCRAAGRATQPFRPHARNSVYERSASAVPRCRRARLWNAHRAFQCRFRGKRGGTEAQDKSHHPPAFHRVPSDRFSGRKRPKARPEERTTTHDDRDDGVAERCVVRKEGGSSGSSEDKRLK